MCMCVCAVPLGSSATAPAFSCQEIKNISSSAQNGFYWVLDYATLKPIKLFCQMSNGINISVESLETLPLTLSAIFVFTLQLSILFPKSEVYHCIVLQDQAFQLEQTDFLSIEVWVLLTCIILQLIADLFVMSLLQDFSNQHFFPVVVN